MTDQQIDFKKLVACLNQARESLIARHGDYPAVFNDVEIALLVADTLSKRATLAAVANAEARADDAEASLLTLREKLSEWVEKSDNGIRCDGDHNLDELRTLV